MDLVARSVQMVWLCMWQEWGSESAPPIVLLHDIGENRLIWTEVAKQLSSAYHVLALDLRGHGDTSRSSRRCYDLDDLIGDIDELVIELSLNGRDWQGSYTRPWVLVGRGTGGALASAYAASKPGRVSALLLIDYDPNWRKDRLAYNRFQVIYLSSLAACKFPWRQLSLSSWLLLMRVCAYRLLTSQHETLRHRL